MTDVGRQNIILCFQIVDILISCVVIPNLQHQIELAGP